MAKPAFNPVEEFLDQLARITSDKNINFIQIGANDGVTHDPLHKLIKKYQWQGLVIEPLPEIFQKLKYNYKDFPYIECLNAAIAPKNQNLTFYEVKDPYKNLPHWIHQLSSFRKSVIQDHSNKNVNLDSSIYKKNVNIIDWQELNERYDLSQKNMLFIDTEGFDAEILKMIDFENHSFDLIIFEQRHLYDNERKEVFKMLQEEGFKLFTFKLDTVAVNAQGDIYNKTNGILSHIDEKYRNKIKGP